MDSNGDMTFGNSALNFYVNKPEAVAQVVKTTLLLWEGEWFLNIDDGTPYMQAILGKHDQGTRDAALQDIVSGVDNVTGIDNYNLSIDPVARKASLSFAIDTVFGPSDVTLQNYTNY